MLKVADDSGFLAVVVPATYSSFVDADWTLDQLFEHFRRQMRERTLLIWGTGLAGMWRVEVAVARPPASGFREVTGPLCVRGGKVLITGYESLTMAAQFEGVKLPEAHEQDQLVSVTDGDYVCRIVQMIDPTTADRASGNGPDFVMELQRATVLPEHWTRVPWRERG